MLNELWNDAAGGFHPVSAPDFLPEQQLREVQLRRLRAVVTRAYERVPLFRQRLEKRAVSPESIQGLADIAKLNIFLTDLGHFPLVNQVMADYFQEPYPARAAVGVASLPKEAQVEMDAVMVLG